MVGLKNTLPWNNHFIADIKVRPVVGAGAHRTRSQNTSMCGESSQGGEGLDWVLYIRIVFSCFRAFGPTPSFAVMSHMRGSTGGLVAEPIHSSPG